MGARIGGGGGARVDARLSLSMEKNISLFGGFFATCSPCWGLFATFFSLCVAFFIMW